MIIIRKVDAVQFFPAKVQQNTDVVIEGSKIAAVGTGAAESRELHEGDIEIDGQGLILFPGLVCSHHHFYSGLSRGILADIGPTPDFVSVLKHLWWKLDRALDEEAVYYSSLICSIDAVSSGTTAVIDHHASPDCIRGSLNQIRRGMEEVGIRGMTCYEVTDRNGGEEELRAGIEENIACAEQIDREKRDGIWSGLTEAAVGGHAPFTIPDYGMAMLRDAVRQTERGIHMHAAEGKYDVSWSHHAYDEDIIDRLKRFDLLNEKSIIVHGVHLSEREADMLNESDAFLIHNARSNMNNGVGYSTLLPKIRNTALGTDGIGADMFEEFRHAYFKHQDAHGPLAPDDYLRFLYNGNEILNRYFGGNFGVLQEGAAADLVLSDYRSPTPLTEQNIAGHIAFGMNSSCVNTVIVHGNIVMHERKFPFDVQTIYAEARRKAEEVWKKMNKD